jgi:ATP-dependent RNA helicase DDX51/DBP6
MNPNHTTTDAIPDHRYSLPSRLVEYTLECTAPQKPLVLLSLLMKYKSKDKLCVVFTSSLDSTHRLTRLLQLVWKEAKLGSVSAVAEFSSALNQNQRSKLLRQCHGEVDEEEDKVEILVCSDGMSRGMDLPQVSIVINYDIPSFAKTYVHRCGRTARGGQEGIAVSLLKKGQDKSFMKMRSFIDHKEAVQTLETKEYLDTKYINVYKKCWKELGRVLEEEKQVHKI